MRKLRGSTGRASIPRENIEETLKCDSLDEIRARCQEQFPWWDGAADVIGAVDPRFVDVVLADRLLDDYDLEETAQRVKCPTLLLHGERDLGSSLRESDVQVFKDFVPHCEELQVTNAGHGLHLEQPQAVMDAVLPFLQRNR